MKLSIDKLLELIELKEGELLRTKLQMNLSRLGIAKVEFFVNRSFFKNEKEKKKIDSFP